MFKIQSPNPKAEARSETTLTVPVHFYSYFKDLTGSAQVTEAVPTGSTIDALLKRICSRFPKLAAMRNATLIAVGVEYQGRNYVLKQGDEVSLFPPVQGG